LQRSNNTRSVTFKLHTKIFIFIISHKKSTKVTPLASFSFFSGDVMKFASKSLENVQTYLLDGIGDHSKVKSQRPWRPIYHPKLHLTHQNLLRITGEVRRCSKRKQRMQKNAKRKIIQMYQIRFRKSSSRGRNQLCRILWQSAQGFRFCREGGGAKFAISHTGYIDLACRR